MLGDTSAATCKAICVQHSPIIDVMGFVNILKTLHTMEGKDSEPQTGSSGNLQLVLCFSSRIPYFLLPSSDP